jgi:tetratricopeptide (TPR) repeat protein
LNRGRSNGTPSVPLYVAMADFQQSKGDFPATEKILEDAVTVEPFNFILVRRLGALYLADQKYDRATICLRKVTILNPESAEDFFQLGRAEENAYQYYGAGQDFAKALALDNRNPVYAAHYTEFKRKVAEGNSH